MKSQPTVYSDKERQIWLLLIGIGKHKKHGTSLALCHFHGCCLSSQLTFIVVLVRGRPYRRKKFAFLWGGEMEVKRVIYEAWRAIISLPAIGIKVVYLYLFFQSHLNRKARGIK